jgi:hypothetical protein
VLQYSETFFVNGAYSTDGTCADYTANWMDGEQFLCMTPGAGESANSAYGMNWISSSDYTFGYLSGSFGRIISGYLVFATSCVGTSGWPCVVQ